MKKILGLFVLALISLGAIACASTTTTTATIVTTTTSATTASTTTSGTTSTTSATTTTTTTASISMATESYPAILNVQFVPSTTVDAAMTTKLVTLEGLLEQALYRHGYVINVNISVGVSYAAVIEAMASEQVHVGFLTAQQYAFTTLEFPGAVDVLLTSVRDAYYAQLDGTTIIEDPETIIANANATGYDGTTNPAVKVNSYYAMLLVRTEDYEDYDTEGLAGLAGKNVGTQSTTSGSGFVYPSFLLSQNGMSFVPNSEGPNAGANEVGYTTISGHQAAVNALLNGDVDAVFTFFDARYHASAYDAWKTANPGKNIFEETRVVALTTGIYNDTITGIDSLSDGLKSAIQQAFIEVIQEPAGLAALTIYNHKGYLIAHDEDYDGERALYQFLHPED